jgi:hypothetical protein
MVLTRGTTISLKPEMTMKSCWDLVAINLNIQRREYSHSKSGFCISKQVLSIITAIFNFSLILIITFFIMLKLDLNALGWSIAT